MGGRFTGVSKIISGILKSNLFRSAGTYGFFSLLSVAIPFLLLPVMTRYLTPDDYGIVAIFGVMVTLATPFVGLSAHGAYGRAFFAPDRFDADVYMGTVVFFVIATGLAMQGLFYLFRGTLSDIFSFPASWMWSVPLVALSSVIGQIVLTSWQVREAPKSYGLFQNGRTLSELLGALGLVVLLGMGWQGRILSKTAVSVLFAMLGIWVMVKNRWLRPRFDRTYLAHALCFGVPLIPHGLAGILNTTIDRVFISHMVGMADTGLYTVGYQIGSIIGLLAGSFNQAYAPWLYRKLNVDSYGKKIKIVRFTYAYFILIILLALFLGLIAPVLMGFLVGREFQGSVVFVVWIAMGYAFSGMYYMVVNYIFYAEKTRVLALATFLGAMINIVLNYFFIKLNGAVGAAQATSLTYVLTFLFVWYVASKVYPMPWKEALKTTKLKDGEHR